MAFSTLLKRHLPGKTLIYLTDLRHFDLLILNSDAYPQVLEVEVPIWMGQKHRDCAKSAVCPR